MARSSSPPRSESARWRALAPDVEPLVSQKGPGNRAFLVGSHRTGKSTFSSVMGAPKLYRLIGPDGREVLSATPGTLGGHRRNKIYGRLDCPGALRWIAKGHYARHRVFFADEATAIAAGYRPCANCLPEQYRSWKVSQRA